MLRAPFVDAHMQLDKRKTLNVMVLLMTVREFASFFVFALLVYLRSDSCGFLVDVHVL